MFSKILDVSASISDIKDDSIIAISGFNMATTPEYLILELYKRYKQQGHPKNIFIVSDALPAVPGRALDQIGESLIQGTRPRISQRSFDAFLGIFSMVSKTCNR